MVLWVGLLSVIVAFPGHTRLLLDVCKPQLDPFINRISHESCFNLPLSYKRVQILSFDYYMHASHIPFPVYTTIYTQHVGVTK